MKMDIRPTTIVIFGASGDLAKRKLIPALFQIYKEGLMPSETKIIGFARKEMSDDVFRELMQESLVKFSRSKPTTDSDEVQSFIGKLYYQQGHYDDKSSFESLALRVGELEKELHGEDAISNKLYYLSTPPQVFFNIVSMLGQTGQIADYHDPEFWTRVIIEKPFGRDLESAVALNNNVRSVLHESQIYRIDHYLGKETVQNILAFRFGNSIYEPLWNRRYIDHVQITVAEAGSVGGRGGYYDHSGALRDMVQNHMLQLLALIAMEPPSSFAPKAVRDEKVKVLSSLRLYNDSEIKEHTVRGQYATGSVAGKKITDFLSEKDVAPDSRTETFVALKFFVDNWRWSGVPFYFRTGKALPKRITEITIQFRQPPLAMFDNGGDHNQSTPNQLSIRVQPNEAIRLRFGLKIPGQKMILQPNEMEFCYSDVFQAEQPEAYERLILDAILGDSTLFIRHDEVDAAWTFVDKILNGWSAQDRLPVLPYRAGTWGPVASDDLMARDGRSWAKL